MQSRPETGGFFAALCNMGSFDRASFAISRAWFRRSRNRAEPRAKLFKADLAAPKAYVSRRFLYTGFERRLNRNSATVLTIAVSAFAHSAARHAA